MGPRLGLGEMEEFILRSNILRFEQLLCATDDPERRWVIWNLLDTERRGLTAFLAACPPTAVAASEAHAHDRPVHPWE